MYHKNLKALYILIIVSCLSPLALDAAVPSNSHSHTSIKVPIINIGGEKAFEWIKTIKMDTMENPYKKDKEITITSKQIIQVKTVLYQIEIGANKLPKSMKKKIKLYSDPDDNDSNEHKVNSSKSTQYYKFYDIFLFIYNSYNSYEEAQKEWKENQLEGLITGINTYFNDNLWFKKEVKDSNFRYAHEQMLGKCKACLPPQKISDDDDTLSNELSDLLKSDMTIKVEKGNDTPNSVTLTFAD